MKYRINFLYGLALGIILILPFIVISIKEKDYSKELLKDIIKVEKINLTTEQDCKKDFMNKCLLARQVYQWTWWARRTSLIGELNTFKYYAMDLREYNDMIELSWKLNRELKIPIDSWENYIQLAHWILESSINPLAEHKTDEVLKFAGYVIDGFRIAFYHYRYNFRINAGHPLYIDYLFQSGIKESDIITYLNNNLLQAVRFDYGYMLHLLQVYNYQWDWTLTAFHFGEQRTEYWKTLGLKEIPNYRLDGHWQGYYLREYYQAVFEIAQGISQGNFSRISQWEKRVDKLKGQKGLTEKYIITFQIKAKSVNEFSDLEKKLKEVNTDFSNAKIRWNGLFNQMSELNDLNLKYRDAERFNLKDYVKVLYKKVIELKNKIRKNYRGKQCGK